MYEITLNCNKDNNYFYCTNDSFLNFSHYCYVIDDDNVHNIYV